MIWRSCRRPANALAFTAAIDDRDCVHCSRDLGSYIGLVPRRHQSAEVDQVAAAKRRFVEHR